MANNENKDDDSSGHSYDPAPPKVQPDFLPPTEEPQSQIDSTEKLTTYNPPPLTENMEVHHHPQVEKKNFREYLLEGLMIFLAVSMGFFAENIRESISDKNKEHEYINSLVSDLKSDVKMYRFNDSINLIYCGMIDSLFIKFKNNGQNTGKIYYLARKLTMIASSSPYMNTKAFLQMTSTGTFRLIKHQQVADSIALYYQNVKSFDNWSDLQRSRVNNIIAASNKLFSAAVFLSIYKAMENEDDSLQQIIQSNPPLLSRDPRDINDVMMHYQYFYGYMKLMNKRTATASAQAEKLIHLLNIEYKLDNE